MKYKQKARFQDAKFVTVKAVELTAASTPSVKVGGGGKGEGGKGRGVGVNKDVPLHRTGPLLPIFSMKSEC